MALPFLPPSLFPKKPPTPPTAHAQSQFVSRLNQEKDRDRATTSVDRAIRGEANAPTSSVFRQGQTDVPTTSVFHPGQTSASFERPDDAAIRDRLRYQHIRQMVKARQETESEEAAAAKDHPMPIRVGKQFRQTGASSVKKVIRRLVKGDRAEYKNISNADRGELKQILENRLQQKKTGTDINRLDRLAMKRAAYKSYRSGTISKADLRDFKGIIKGMK